MMSVAAGVAFASSMSASSSSCDCKAPSSSKVSENNGNPSLIRIHTSLAIDQRIRRRRSSASFSTLCGPRTRLPAGTVLTTRQPGQLFEQPGRGRRLAALRPALVLEEHKGCAIEDRRPALWRTHATVMIFEVLDEP